ncbi:hypothetical protein [Cupriavidus sp. DL-D2]|uniref:hypothetical protein n=1 Tax=Cupriavidus sp. DL-D2 TaxID=3144974 RepID=UPI0032143DB9
MSAGTCKHAASGCDYPAGECGGACVRKPTQPTDAERYTRAMIDGNLTTLVMIERKHDLFGYPPDIVSIGLRAVARGQDAHEAIDRHLADDQS